MTMKFADYKEYLAPVLFKATDIVVESAKGCYVTDIDGNEYLDFVQGIAVNAFGHTHPKIIQAAKDQLDKITCASFNLVNFQPTLKLAKGLAEITPGELNVTFFSNGGAEANDSALKLARNYTGRPGIIAMRGSFHGRTMGCTAVTGSAAKYRKHQEPLVPSVYFTPYPTCFRCPYNAKEDTCALECLQELQRLFDYLIYPEDVACLIMEPVMGEGGYVVPPKKYVTALSALLKKHGILLIFDEIQSGFGRTGKMFASEHFGVVPDIMTCGKAIAGGLPMSACISTKEIHDSWTPGTHGTTFGGSPVPAAAACAVLDLFKESDVLANVNEQGDHLYKRLIEIQKKNPCMGDVRGIGLMRAVEFVHPADNAPNADALNFVKSYCLKHGMLTLSCGVFGNGFRFATPLNIDRATLDKGIDIFEAAVTAYTAQYKK